MENNMQLTRAFTSPPQGIMVYANGNTTQTQSNSEPVSDPQKLNAPQGFLKKKEHKTS